MLNRRLDLVLKIGKIPHNELLPQLKVIADMFNIKLNRSKDFRIAIRLLINSILNN